MIKYSLSGLKSFFDNLKRAFLIPNRGTGRVGASLGSGEDMVNMCLKTLSSFSFESSADLLYLLGVLKWGCSTVSWTRLNIGGRFRVTQHESEGIVNSVPECPT